MSQVVTGEAVALDLRAAALPSRVVAGFLDALAQSIALFLLLIVVGAVSSQTSGAAAAALSIVVFVLVLVGYPVVFETLLRGRTPGKAAMGLRVVRDDGGPVGFRQAFVRGLAGAFVERPGITFFLAGVLSMLLNSRGKRLGDLLAGTVVLQERVAASGGVVAVMPPPLAGWAAGLDLSGLSDGVALQARQFLARSGELTPQARDDLGGRLVTAVTAAVTPPPPTGTPGWAVLSAVLAERRRREELRRGVGRPPTSTAATPRQTAAPDPHDRPADPDSRAIGPTGTGTVSPGPDGFAPPG